MGSDNKLTLVGAGLILLAIGLALTSTLGTAAVVAAVAHDNNPAAAIELAASLEQFADRCELEATHGPLRMQYGSQVYAELRKQTSGLGRDLPTVSVALGELLEQCVGSGGTHAKPLQAGDLLTVAYLSREIAAEIRSLYGV